MEKKEFDALLENCRLSLDESEYERIKADVDEIIKYFDQIDSIGTGDYKEAFHPVEIPGEYRNDDPKKFEDVKGILENTKTHRLFVLGPKI